MGQTGRQIARVDEYVAAIVRAAPELDVEQVECLRQALVPLGQ
jgi:hypothetical protein